MIEIGLSWLSVVCCTPGGWDILLVHVQVHVHVAYLMLAWDEMYPHIMGYLYMYVTS